MPSSFRKQRYHAPSPCSRLRPRQTNYTFPESCGFERPDQSSSQSQRENSHDFSFLFFKQGDVPRERQEFNHDDKLLSSILPGGEGICFLSPARRLVGFVT